MEPLPAACIAALTPPDVEKVFYDDRLEAIPFDQPTDLVAISVETYTARRAYEIASEFRQRGVKVVMGGFHAALCADEVSRYADSVVVGEAEELFPRVLDDWRHGQGERVYRAERRPRRLDIGPDRSIFRGKRYLPISLIESARGCRFACEFCAITAAFKGTQNRAPIDRILREVRTLKRPGRLFFFIDDNIVSDLAGAKELFRALAGEGIRWVGQASSNVAFDEEALILMAASGCQGILIGFESLDGSQLRQMNKAWNLAKGGPVAALANLRRHNIRVYGTFIFGYDQDDEESFGRAVRFARDEGMFIAAFNHLTPFPGTPLYARLEREGRLRFPAWWLDPGYRYGMVPFIPALLSPDELERRCIAARRSFYGWPSILSRASQRVNRRDPWMLVNFLAINAMHRADVVGRNHMPLGDESWTGKLLPAG
ncbi:MAG: B12-binding domain-containing radical SAM protein [Planctomycetes bacterium]|nr:B12-binding domain-containing radical SAM protein [Planctomycetota bacterium]